MKKELHQLGYLIPDDLGFSERSYLFPVDSFSRE